MGRLRVGPRHDDQVNTYRTSVRRALGALVLAAALGGLIAPARAAPTSGTDADARCRPDPAPGRAALELGRTFDESFVDAMPEGWSLDDPEAFDWDGDGIPDELVATAEGPVVRWGTGELQLAGSARADVSPAVADVTGDGVPDLIVADGQGAAVLVGDRGRTTGRVPLDALGTRVAGWRSVHPDPDPERLREASHRVLPLWDLTGDGIADYAIVHTVERAGSLLEVHPGRPCGEAGPQVRAPTGVPDRSRALGPASVGTGGPPTVAGRNLPDPSIMRGPDGRYHLHATNTWTEHGHVLNTPVMSASHPLGPWSTPTEAFPIQNIGTWTAQRYTEDQLLRTWAPSVVHVPTNPPGRRYLLYYAALRAAGPQRMCIGRARAIAPTGPFLDDYGAPLICSDTGFIDPDPVLDGNQLRLLVSGDEDVAGQANRLWSVDLTASGEHYLGTPFRTLLVKSRPWETAVGSPTAPHGKIENPTMAIEAGRRWLLYSGGNWQTADYAIGVASCTSSAPPAPCTRNPADGGGPWLAADTHAAGPGGADVVRDADGRWWLVHHGWDPERVGPPHPRQLYVREIGFGPQGPTTAPVPGAPRDVQVRAQHSSVALSWAAPAHVGAGVEGYRVYVVRDGVLVAPPLDTESPVAATTVEGLDNGATYGFWLQSYNRHGTSEPVPVASTATPVDAPSRFVPVPGFRALDTRDGSGRCDAGTAPGARIGGWTVATVALAGCAGLPAAEEIVAVVANVTVVGAASASHLVVWPTGEMPPSVSNANFSSGETVAVHTTVRTGDDGSVSLALPASSAHVVLDVVGYFGAPGGATGSLHRSQAPARLLDTRDGTGTGTGCGPGAAGRIGPRQTRVVRLAGCAGLAGVADLGAVELNVTVVGAIGATHLTVWVGGVRPDTSALNVASSRALANMAVTSVQGPDLSIYNQAGWVDVIVDVLGSYGPDGGATGAGFHALSPRRAVDTRLGLGTTASPFGGGTSRVLPLAGVETPRLGTGLPPPGTASAVVGVLTQDQGTARSHFTLWPAGSSRPLASHLNFERGEARANMVSVALGGDGSLGAYNALGWAHLVLDVAGWFGPEQ